MLDYVMVLPYIYIGERSVVVSLEDEAPSEIFPRD
jgi:hypothetical protein